MTSNLNQNFDSAPMQVKIGGAFAVAALALLALNAGLEWARITPATGAAGAPAPNQVATFAQTPGVRTLTYYPEHLAALTSLSSFEPVEDKGVVQQPPLAVALSAAKATRHAEAKTPAPAPNAPLRAATPAPATAPANKSLKILGVSVPGPAEVGERMASLRDNASRLGDAVLGLGGRIPSFWR